MHLFLNRNCHCIVMQRIWQRFDKEKSTLTFDTFGRRIHCLQWSKYEESSCSRSYAANSTNFIVFIDFFISNCTSKLKLFNCPIKSNEIKMNCLYFVLFLIPVCASHLSGNNRSFFVLSQHNQEIPLFSENSVICVCFF